MRTLSIDIETYSDVPLQKSGVYRYCESPNFEILLFGYSADSGPVQVVDLACGEKIPSDVLDALTDDAVTKWAFNASFERVCLSRYLRDLGISLDPFHDRHPLSQECAQFLNPENWRCSPRSGKAETHRRQGSDQVLLPALRSDEDQRPAHPEPPLPCSE